jgi:MFS family permease
MRASATASASLKQRIYPWLIVAGCCCMQIGGIGVFLDLSGVFFVPAGAALGIPPAEYGRYMSVSFLGTAAAAVVAGMLIDKINIRILIGVNVTITAVGFMLMGYYPEMWMRYAFSLAQGFCGGFYFMIMTPVLINNWFIRRKGLALGMAMSASSLGAAILAPIITHVIDLWGWQAAYAFTGTLVLVLIIPWVLFVFRETPAEIGLKPYGWQTLADKNESTTKQESAKRGKQEGVPSKKAVPTISFFAAAAFVACFAMFASFSNHINAFGQSIGYSPMLASTLLIAVSIGSVAEKVVMGLLYDIIGIYKVIWINCVLLAFGLFLLGTQTALPLIYLGAALFGIQNSLVAVQTPLLIRELFGNRDFAKLVPYMRVGLGLCGATGPALIASIVSATGSYNAVWLTGLLFVLLGACFAITARMNKRRHMRYWIDADNAAE